MQRRTLPTPIAWAFAPFVAISIVHVVSLGIASPIAGWTKLLLMPLLAVPVLLSARRVTPSAALVLLLLALLFSWLGDSVGAFLPTAPELPLILGFFGIAHLVYILLFVRHLTTRRMP